MCGGAGGIGQPLSMFMAQNPHVSELCVFDLTLAMVPAGGVAFEQRRATRGGACHVKARGVPHVSNTPGPARGVDSGRCRVGSPTALLALQPHD